MKSALLNWPSVRESRLSVLIREWAIALTWSGLAILTSPPNSRSRSAITYEDRPASRTALNGRQSSKNRSTWLLRLATQPLFTSCRPRPGPSSQKLVYDVHADKIHLRTSLRGIPRRVILALPIEEVRSIIMLFYNNALINALKQALEIN